MPDSFRIRMGREDAPPALSGKTPGSAPRRRRRGFSRALKEAQGALARGEAEKSLAILEDLRRRRPTHPHVLIHLGRAQAAVGDPDTATETFYKAKEHSANNPVGDLFLGQSLIQHERLDEAEKALRRCLELDPKNTVVANHLALCLFRQGRHAEAFQEWNRAGWLFEPDLLVDVTIVFERFLLEAPEPPDPELPPASDLSSDTAPSPEDLGLATRMWRRWRFRRLIGKAEAHLAEHETVDAYETAGQALALAPGDPDALLLRAVAMYEGGRYEDAAQILLEIIPKDASILPQCFLAYCLLRLGAVEVALDMLTKLGPEGPFDYYLHYNIGLCHLIQGDAAQARRYFHIAYTQYFIDSREYCFEYLLRKVHARVKHLHGETEQ